LWRESLTGRWDSETSSVRRSFFDMIVQNPTDQELRSADIIALFDLSHPGWHEVLVNVLREERMSPRDFLVIDIPVDSANQHDVKRWREHVARLRAASEMQEPGRPGIPSSRTE